MLKLYMQRRPLAMQDLAVYDDAFAGGRKWPISLYYQQTVHANSCDVDVALYVPDIG